MAALTTRAANATLVDSATSINSDPFKSVFGNGLLPMAKPHTAVAQKINAAVAAFRRLPHKPAHISGIKTKNPSRLR